MMFRFVFSSSDMLPRLCPERWITTQDYHPSDDMVASSMVGSINELGSDLSTTLPTGASSRTHRSIGRHLSVRANELVYVLGKR